jgi:hypothetical protein
LTRDTGQIWGTFTIVAAAFITQFIGSATDSGTFRHEVGNHLTVAIVVKQPEIIGISRPEDPKIVLIVRCPEVGAISYQIVSSQSLGGISDIFVGESGKVTSGTNIDFSHVCELSFIPHHIGGSP